MRAGLSYYAGSIFLILMPALAFAEIPKFWKCGSIEWTMPAQYAKGHFKGALSVQCEFNHPKTLELSRVIERTNSELKRRFTADPPSPQALNPIHFFHGTEKLGMEEDEEIEITQSVTLESLPNRMRLETEAQEISATGMSAYLKGLRVVTELEIQEDRPRTPTLKIESGMSVQRPWYAPSFLFEKMARSRAEEKFHASRDRILGEFSTRFEGAFK